MPFILPRRPVAAPALRLFLISAVLGIIWVGCTEPASEPAVPDAATTDAIMAASQAFSDAYIAGDTTALGVLYTPDAVLLPPGRMVRGRASIRRYFSPSPRRRNLAHAMTSEELTVTGRTAVDIGTWSNTWQIDDGAPQTSSERYLVVWQLGDDGQWRIAYDMWHRP